ncbi:sigma-70 family RNA polymerase sigma factor [Chitinophaga nivalis]|uniref:Sigma-70 family RNA polymerase sigma factor n=1 Tax=Chitinophaga nivalis TaxID=2991709 RepID=A0ABT3IWC5_9BACT|nr:sigma-70 family RNA polymerase sigma factor [Chitinophaga nivalis]MCW3462017.1 sigma-70 family RNA polymerase sigma factor [Chitinophaga nivalis]MCW3488291.1 sigma-70 family RNA polymerase sigma factor [Chitinophaga nivalis]
MSDEQYHLKDYQRVLFPYAYNILGSAEDAKDAIQDVLSNYVATHREGITNEKNYLIKSVVNQSINIRNRRKTVSSDDVWLPEPVATEAADANINLRDVASYSLLILLEQLNPKERAVFILKEAFGYSHEEIAEVLSSTVENSRKLLSRAKARLDPAQRPVSTGKVTPDILNNYINALTGGDTQQLESLLSKDISFFADGGTTHKVVKKTCQGLREVTDLLIYLYKTYQSALSMEIKEINHQPAILLYNGPQLISCQVFRLDETDGRIAQISVLVDPEKLKSLTIA